MGERPRYTRVFETLEEKYDFAGPDTPLTRFYKADIYGRQYEELDGTVAPDRVGFAAPEEAGGAVEEMARAAGAELVGFTGVNDTMVFQGAGVPHSHAVSLGMSMDFEVIGSAPEEPAGTEVLRVYWRLGDVACKVAAFIRSLGYPARAHHPRATAGFPPTVLHTTAALEAGLGEMGRNGLLITPEFGPRVRLATVTTDLAVPQARRMSFGVEEYCGECDLCRKYCEGGAIPDGKTVVRGHEKYTIDYGLCLEPFARYDGCNLCVSRCAFNRRPEELKSFIRSLRRPG